MCRSGFYPEMYALPYGMGPTANRQRSTDWYYVVVRYNVGLGFCRDILLSRGWRCGQWLISGA